MVAIEGCPSRIAGSRAERSTIGAHGVMLKAYRVPVGVTGGTSGALSETDEGIEWVEDCWRKGFNHGNHLKPKSGSSHRPLGRIGQFPCLRLCLLGSFSLLSSLVNFMLGC